MVPPGRLRRGLAAIGATIGLAAVFVTAAVTAVVIHLPQPPARRLLQRAVNNGLGSALLGTVTVGEIDQISFHGLDIRSVSALDPEGEPVVFANGLHIRVELLPIMGAALFGRGELGALVSLVRLDDAAVQIRRGPDGTPTLGETFMLRSPSPPKKGARGVALTLARIELGHAWVYGEIVPSRSFNGDVNRLVASVQATPRDVTVDVEQVGFVERGLLPATIAGSANVHLRASIPASGAPADRPLVNIGAAFSGQIGEIEVQAKATIDGGRIAGKVEVPRASPEQLRSVLPTSPVQKAVSANIDIEGDIPTLVTSGQIALEGGGGTLAVEGHLDTHGPPRIEATVHAVDVDLAALSPLKDTSPVNAAARIRVELGPVPRLEAEATNQPFSLAGRFIPAVDAHAVLDRGVLYGTFTAHEPGAPTSGTISFSRDAGLKFDVVSEIPALDAVPRIPAKLAGSARVHVNGTLRGQAVEAQINGSVAGVEGPNNVALDEGRIEGRITGRTDAITAAVIDASVKGKKLRAGDRSFEDVTVSARGSLVHPHVEARLAASDDPNADAIEASGDLDPADRAARGLKVRMKRGAAVVEGEIARAAVSPGGITVDGLRIEGNGIGKITGGIRMTGKELAGRIHGEDVDLERIGKLLGVPRPLRGVTDFDVALDPTPKGRKGHVQIAIENGDFGLVSGVSTLINADFDDDKVTADGLVRVIAHAAKDAKEDDRCDGSIAEVQVSGGEGRLAGPLLDVRTWDKLTGRVHLAANGWNLHCLSKLAPVGMFLSDVRGLLDTAVTVERPVGQRFASIHDLEVRTRGLALAGPLELRDGAPPAPAWRSRALDVQITGNIDGETGKTKVTGAVIDDAVLAQGYISASLDLPLLWDAPDRRVAQLKATPIEGHLAIPRRKLATLVSLPTFIKDKLPGLSGELRAGVDLRGTVDKPLATLHAEGFGIAHATSLEHPTPTPYTLPIDIDVAATLDDRKLSFETHAGRRNKEFFDGAGELKVGAGLAGASFHGKLTDAPVGRLPVLADHDISGHVSGAFSASDLDTSPKINLDLTMPDLKIGPDLTFDHGLFTMTVKDNTAELKADLLDKKRGKLDASASAGLTRVAGGVEIDDERPIALDVKASRFRLSALQPLTARALSKLDGYLDGTAHMSLGQDLTVNMKVSEGVFHIPTLGQEFHGATATIVADRSGTVRITDITAKAQHGQIKGTVTARLPKLAFQGADVKLTIAEGQEIPLTLEGVPFGNARGELNIHADKHDRSLDVKVTIPELHLDLPSAVGRRVQGLDDNPDIVPSHAIDQDDAKEPRPADALEITMITEIDRLIIKGSGIDMTIRTAKDAPPKIVITDKPRIGGDIIIDRGTFEVMSKKFEVERGLVRLRPDEPGNPYVNVRARWDSPSARVYVDYAGVLFPINNDKLKFTSDPPETQSEILALMIFGGEQYTTVAGGDATPGGTGPGGVALGVGAGLVASQFNALLSGLAPIKNFTAQFSAADDGTLRPSLAYTLGDRLHVVATYDASQSPSTGGASTGAGASSAGAATGARSSQTSLNLDWRFRPNWLLRGTLSVGGDQTSTGLDLLWQYRY